MAITKGVILRDDEIKRDVNVVSKCVAAERICSKDGKRCRAVKISFSDNESLEKTLKNGLQLMSDGRSTF